MLHLLAKNWWMLLLRGILAILFGIFAYLWPGLTLITLIIIYAAYALVDGIVALLAALTTHPGAGRAGWLVLIGILGVAFGLITFFWPGETALVLMMLIGVWAVVRGVFEIVAAIQLRKQIADEWFWILSGIISILFGALFLVHPGAGAVALVWIVATYAIIYGGFLVAFAFRLKRHRHLLTA
jgi:uncharacterized membrane protein HdeD (DUF308 family)